MKLGGGDESHIVKLFLNTPPTPEPFHRFAVPLPLKDGFAPPTRETRAGVGFNKFQKGAKKF